MECIDTDEFEKRHQLAMARQALLDRLVDTKMRADRLRSWLSAYRRFDKTAAYPELRRMLEWAQVELAELDACLDPAQLCATLRERNLFPEIASLHDALGAADIGQRPADSTLAIR